MGVFCQLGNHSHIIINCACPERGHGAPGCYDDVVTIMFILCIPARFPDTPGGPLQRAGKDPVLGREECEAPRAPRPQEVQAEVPRHPDLEGLSRELPG